MQVFVLCLKCVSFFGFWLITTVGITLYHQYPTSSKCRSNAALLTPLPPVLARSVHQYSGTKPGPSLTVSTQQSASNPSTYIDAQRSRCLLWWVLITRILEVGITSCFATNLKVQNWEPGFAAGMMEIEKRILRHGYCAQCSGQRRVCTIRLEINR